MYTIEEIKIKYDVTENEKQGCFGLVIKDGINTVFNRGLMCCDKKKKAIKIRITNEAINEVVRYEQLKTSINQQTP